MKGIGIILMLIGHIPPGYRVYHFIYSFHMPLFFIVAGRFASILQSDEEWKRVLKKDFQRLVIPVIVTMLFVILLSPLHYITDKNFHHVVQEALSLLWAGDSMPTRWGDINSPMWFLLSLFWVRTIFRFVERYGWRQSKRHDEIVLVICALLSVAAVLLNRHVGFPVPWGILRGMSALLFYSIGWYIKRHGLPLFLSLGFVVVWILALKYGGIDMYEYKYNCFPLDILGAVGATWLVYLLSKGVCKITPKGSLLLQWFGVNSLLIFCIHCLDRRTYLVRAIKGVVERAFNVEIFGDASVLFHYGIEIVLVVIVTFVPFFKKVYGAKRLIEI